ncbi:hypothetical protein ElyMa_004018500 [Elysia marginata]|uniref:Uncharacterized protein n=1 Tax=Elysia marginata TaxID=1093978 RepID=A0AAV4G0U3_9GAST|nr:hypothetical protein ElyMa_004018500 [Elysia marginata]
MWPTVGQILDKDGTQRIHVHWSPSTTSKPNLVPSPTSPPRKLPYTQYSSVDLQDYPDKQNDLQPRYLKRISEGSTTSSTKSIRSIANSSTRRSLSSQRSSKGSVRAPSKDGSDDTSRKSLVISIPLGVRGSKSSSKRSSIAEARAGAWLYPGIFGPLAPDVYMANQNVDVITDQPMASDVDLNPGLARPKSSKRNWCCFC